MNIATLYRYFADLEAILLECSTRPADLRQIELTKDLAYRYFIPFLEE